MIRKLHLLLLSKGKPYQCYQPYHVYTNQEGSPIHDPNPYINLRECNRALPAHLSDLRGCQGT